MRVKLNLKIKQNLNCEIKQNYSFERKENPIFEIKQNPTFKNQTLNLRWAFRANLDFKGNKI